MFSRILIKLVDEAIFPAILLLMTRLISMLMVSKYLGVGFEMGKSGLMFNNVSDFVAVNSYSTLFMALAIVLGLIFITFKSFVFHDSHITPGLSAKLFSLRVSSLIQNSLEIYSQGTIWLSYLYLILIVCMLMTLFGMLYSWVLFVVLIATVLITTLFIVDIEHEVKIGKSKEAQYDTDEKYLERERDE